MTLTLELPPDVEGAIAQAAQQQGTTPERLALDGLRGLFVPSPQAQQRPMHPYNPEGLIAALDALEEGDAEKQRVTLEHLMVALDRNRPGERSIFGQGVNPVPSGDETE